MKKKYLVFISGIILIIGVLIFSIYQNKTEDVLGATVLQVFQGGTGTSTNPSYGKMLVGNHSGTYTLTATSSLGISGSGSGTVTSVAMSVPTGLTISGSPITTAGTLALTYTAGYAGVLTASSTEWATSYGWGDHASAGYVPYTGATADLDLGSNALLLGVEGSGSTIVGNSATTINVNGANIELLGGDTSGGAGGTGNGGNIDFGGGNAYGIGKGGDLNLSAGSSNGGTAGVIRLHTGSVSVGALLDTSSITFTDKTFTFPDQSGTLALTSDLFTQAIASTTFVDRADWTTIDNYPTGCTNQFVRTIGDTLSCASVANTDLTNSTIGLTSSGSITIGTSPISLGGTSALNLNMANANSWTALQTFGNASTTLFSASYASSTSGYFGSAYLPNLAVAAGTFLAVNGDGLIIATTTPSGGTGITSLGGQTGAAQTFATSTDTNLGLTIISSGDIHTFTTSWAGTLTAARIGLLSGFTDASTILGGDRFPFYQDTSGANRDISWDNLMGQITNTGTLADLTVTGLSTLNGGASTTLLTVSGDSWFNTIKSGTWNGAAIADAYVADDITASNYLSLTAWFATTTHQLINSLPALATVGTITTGVWNGTIIANQFGGTGQNSGAWTGVASLAAGIWSASSSVSSAYIEDDFKATTIGIGSTSPIEELGIVGQMYVDGSNTATSTMEGNFKICNDTCSHGVYFQIGTATTSLISF